MDKLLELLKEINLPFAYHHFAEGEVPNLPYLVYLTLGTNHFKADGKVYFKVMEVHIELYLDKKEPEMEKRVEEVLDNFEVCYEKAETYIESEKLYEVIYTFEMEE